MQILYNQALGITTQLKIYKKISSDEEEENIAKKLKSMNNKQFNELDFEFKREESEEAIKKLKNNKSPGLDLISNEMIRHGSPHIHSCILSLFNKIYSTGDYPDC